MRRIIALLAVVPWAWCVLVAALDRRHRLSTSAVSSQHPTAGLVSYSAAKAGISAGFRALTREVRPRGVSVIGARPPHAATGLAGRALCGEPPKMRKGLDPAVVAERLVLAIEQDERDVPASAFTP